MILSNIVENGKPIGLADAGQGWHTDMSYSRMIAFCNVLYGIKIPHRNGQPLGNTEFCDQHAAYEGLPDELKRRLEGKTVLHDFNKFWEMMRREKGSTRPPLTEAQRKAKPPVSQPIFLDASDHRPQVPLRQPRLRDAHQRAAGGGERRDARVPVRAPDQPEYRYAHRWHGGDVLMWDNMRTIHNAVADYGPDEPRLIKRCQVMATRFLQGASMTNRLLGCCIAMLAGVAASTGAARAGLPGQAHQASSSALPRADRPTSSPVSSRRT